jgi:hypothetical protein
MTFNRQDAFDRAVTGIIKQGRFAVRDGSCCYRFDPDAKAARPLADYPPEVCYATAPCRCAVGQLIPDDKYDITMEGKLAYAASIVDALGNPDEEDLRFLQALQEIHDACARDDESLDAFISDARVFARQYGLNTAVLP